MKALIIGIVFAFAFVGFVGYIQMAIDAWKRKQK